MKSQLLLLFGVLFSASFLFSCIDDDQDEEPLEGSGNITFYINESMPCNEIIFMLFSPDGRETPGKLQGNAVFNGVPECGYVPSMSFMNRAYGRYSYSVRCANITFTNSVTLDSPCQTIRIRMP